MALKLLKVGLPGGGSTDLVSVELHGGHYAAGRVYVSLGTANLSEPKPTYAVLRLAGKNVSVAQKHINVDDVCLAKLEEWGLSAGEAKLLLTLADLYDDTRVPSLQAQEREGGYLEAIDEIVEVAIADGYTRRSTTFGIKAALAAAVNNSRYTREPWWQAITVEYGKPHAELLHYLTAAAMLDAVTDRLEKLIKETVDGAKAAQAAQAAQDDDQDGA
jgi:hypothetical protein